jgi:hypothetical protein
MKTIQQHAEDLLQATFDIPESMAEWATERWHHETKQAKLKAIEEYLKRNFPMKRHQVVTRITQNADEIDDIFITFGEAVSLHLEKQLDDY